MYNLVSTERPSAPGRPEVVEASPKQIKLRWLPPGDDGGTQITNYVIEMREAGTHSWSTLPLMYRLTDTNHTVTGLPEGSYEFRIIAENKVGQSEPSVSTSSHSVKPAPCEFVC